MNEAIAMVRLPAPGLWAQRGACRGKPETAALFFPAPGDDPRPAKQICAACPVEADCLTYAMSCPGLEGIWGGTTHNEREALRRVRRISAAAS